MDGRTLGFLWGFVKNLETATQRAESHPGSRWEMAEGTTLVFDAFGEGDVANAQVRFKLARTGEKMNWTIEVLETS